MRTDKPVELGCGPDDFSYLLVGLLLFTDYGHVRFGFARRYGRN